MSEYESCKFCRAQALRVEVLEEELRQIRDALAPEWQAPAELRLTTGQYLIVACLLAHERVCSETMLMKASRIRGREEPEDGSNLVAVQVSNIRRKFAAHGLVIETVKCLGYRLTQASRDRLLNWKQQAARAA